MKKKSKYVQDVQFIYQTTFLGLIWSHDLEWVLRSGSYRFVCHVRDQNQSSVRSSSCKYHFNHEYLFHCPKSLSQSTWKMYQQSCWFVRFSPQGLFLVYGSVITNIITAELVWDVFINGFSVSCCSFESSFLFPCGFCVTPAWL